MAPDSINTTGGEIDVNGRRYRLPKQPIVVVCIDGSVSRPPCMAFAATTSSILTRAKR